MGPIPNQGQVHALDFAKQEKLPDTLSHYYEILKSHMDSYRTGSLPQPITPPLCRYALCCYSLSLKTIYTLLEGLTMTLQGLQIVHEHFIKGYTNRGQ